MKSATNSRLQGLQAHAQGERFENRLGMAFDLYRASSLADIRKTPEPMRPVKSLGGGKFVAYFEQKAQADYAGVLKGGRAVALESKFTTKDRIEQVRVTLEQAKFLDTRAEMGALCFVMAGFATGGVYRVPWEVWRDMKREFGRKYVTENDLQTYRVPVTKTGLPLVLEEIV